jgi:hypothetical protein
MNRNSSEVARSKAMTILPERTAVALIILTTIDCMFAFSLKETKMQIRQVNTQRWSITSPKQTLVRTIIDCLDTY